MKGRTRLMIGSSEGTADLLYRTRFFVPDDLVWFERGGESYVLVSPLEIDRAKRTAKVDHVLSLKEAEERTKRQIGRTPAYLDVVAQVLKEHKARSVEVPEWFPAGYAAGLQKRGIGVKLAKGSFCPEREIKTAVEIRSITEAQRCAEAGLRRGIEVLTSAKIVRGGYLRFGNGRLTSEALRAEINAAVIRAGALPAHTIVAGGRQACDPHEEGRGPLKSGETIILDIFPRSEKSGYFGDLTRTVVKGKASDAIKRLYRTVRRGQEMALGKMRAGVDGKQLHECVLEFFKREGYATEQRKGRWVGFFHGTGHSLGLEIHEPPRFAAGKFKAGHIMTVEPGLYYPSIGGVRIEDLVVIRKTGVTNLTRVAKRLEIA